jgi:hypothetical protein
MKKLDTVHFLFKIRELVKYLDPGSICSIFRIYCTVSTVQIVDILNCRGTVNGNRSEPTVVLNCRYIIVNFLLERVGSSKWQ